MGFTLCGVWLWIKEPCCSNSDSQKCGQLSAELWEGCSGADSYNLLFKRCGIGTSNPWTAYFDSAHEALHEDLWLEWRRFMSGKMFVYRRYLCAALNERLLAGNTISIFGCQASIGYCGGGFVWKEPLLLCSCALVKKWFVSNCVLLEWWLTCFPSQ